MNVSHCSTNSHDGWRERSSGALIEWDSSGPEPLIEDRYYRNYYNFILHCFKKFKSEFLVFYGNTPLDTATPAASDQYQLYTLCLLITVGRVILWLLLLLMYMADVFCLNILCEILFCFKSLNLLWRMLSILWTSCYCIFILSKNGSFSLLHAFSNRKAGKHGHCICRNTCCSLQSTLLLRNRIRNRQNN